MAAPCRLPVGLPPLKPVMCRGRASYLSMLTPCLKCWFVGLAALGDDDFLSARVVSIVRQLAGLDELDGFVDRLGGNVEPFRCGGPAFEPGIDSHL